MDVASVADPGCLSRIPDPDFYPSRILDPRSWNQKQQQKRGVRKNLLSFFLETNITKWKLFYFWSGEEQNLGQFTKNCRTFYPKIVIKLSKIWVWDLGSEKREQEKTYSGSRIQGLKRNRIPDPQHCLPHNHLYGDTKNAWIFGLPSIYCTYSLVERSKVEAWTLPRVRRCSSTGAPHSWTSTPPTRKIFSGVYKVFFLSAQNSLSTVIGETNPFTSVKKEKKIISTLNGKIFLIPGNLWLFECEVGMIPRYRSA